MKGLLSPVACQIYRSNFPPVGFIQSRTVFTNALSINSDHTTRNMTWAVLIHIQIETIGALDRSSDLFFCGLYELIISCSMSPLYRLYSKTKPSAMCARAVTLDVIMYELQKAIKLQKCSWTSWCHSESDSGKSMTFEIAHCVFTLLRYEERDKISPICLVVVPLIACLLAWGVDPSIWSLLAAEG